VALEFYQLRLSYFACLTSSAGIADMAEITTCRSIGSHLRKAPAGEIASQKPSERFCAIAVGNRQKTSSRLPERRYANARRSERVKIRGVNLTPFARRNTRSFRALQKPIGSCRPVDPFDPFRVQMTPETRKKTLRFATPCKTQSRALSSCDNRISRRFGRAFRVDLQPFATRRLAVRARSSPLVLTLAESWTWMPAVGRSAC